MKALILDGSKKDDSTLKNAYEAIEDQLGFLGWEINLLKLREMEIADCLGCFFCWTKTPGKCVINDAGQNMAEMVFRSDLLVFLTPVTFGGYSSCLKKAVDRLVAAILSSWVRIEGEFHHKLRFKKRPKLIVLGSLANPDENSQRLFETLARRNAINLQSSASAGIVLSNTENNESLKVEVRKLFIKLGIMK